MAKLPASDAQHPELHNSIQSLEQKQQARAAEISLVPDLDMAGARGSAYAARDWLASQGQQVRSAAL